MFFFFINRIKCILVGFKNIYIIFFFEVKYFLFIISKVILFFNNFIVLMKCECMFCNVV